MHLPDFPTGHTIFVDANCLIYYFTGTYASCALLMERASRRELRLMTSVTVISEVHHRLMVLETVQRFGRPLRHVPSFLKKHPEIIRSLDGLIVATMRAHHLIHLASNDTDFTRVPGITLWRP